jgi:hypothetical protein
MKGCWVLSKVFLASTEMIIWFLAFILFMCLLHLLICVFWTNLESLEWNQGVYHCIWSFYNVLLNSVCKYFIENFYVYVHQTSRSIVLFFVGFLPCFVIKEILAS